MIEEGRRMKREKGGKPKKELFLTSSFILIVVFSTPSFIPHPSSLTRRFYG
jgi:hypothetical protein